MAAASPGRKRLIPGPRSWLSVAVYAAALALGGPGPGPADTAPACVADPCGGGEQAPAFGPLTAPDPPLGEDDLIVHEWGVFTVFNDAPYANANRKEEWGSLPSFFYRQFPAQRLRWLPAAWDKPVIYFYAKRTPMRVRVHVTFPEGAPVVWWPAVASPVDARTIPSFPHPSSRKGPFRALWWDAWLGDQLPANVLRPLPGSPAVQPAKDGAVTDFPLPKDCWLRHARLPGATRLTVTGNFEAWPSQHRFPGVKDRAETERFIYYDGLVPAPDYLRCEKVDVASLTLRNRAKFDLGPLFVVDRRAKGGAAVVTVGGKDDPFRAGQARVVTPQRVADWPAAGVKAVRQALCDAGLFGPEADALLTIWQKRLFEAEGVTAFHLLPAAEYDRMLPLIVLPAPPRRPVRVGIAVHPHLEIEPDLTTRIATLIGRLGDEDFETRAAAGAALAEIGPLAMGQLRAELQKTIPLETRRRIEAVLDRFDASVWLNPMKK